MSFLRRLFEGEVATLPAPAQPALADDERERVDLVLESFRRFAADRIDAGAIDRGHALAPELRRGLAELGLFGLGVPEEMGGLGLGSTAYARVLEEVSRVSASVAVTLGAHQSIGLKAILLFGSDEQKRRWLPALASGERIAGFALTEPNAGSDAGGIRTTARPRDGGWVLNGSKQWITNGGFGGLFTVFAKAPLRVGGEEREAVTAFLVGDGHPGFRRGPEEDKLGISGSSTTALFFADVEVPDEDRLGEVGQGFKIAMAVLNEGRLGLAAGAVGGMKAALELASRYARERHQFGREIASFDMVREKLARIATDCWAAESMVYATTGLVDAGESDFSLESAACKVFASEACWRAADAALQVAGGYGYMRDYPFERLLRDARINTIFEGTNEILRLYLAASGLRGPGDALKEVAEALRHPLSSIGVLGDFAVRSLRRRVMGVKLAGIEGALAPQAETWSELAGRFAEASERALREHGKGILEREIVLERLADAAMDLYAVAASLGRAAAAVAAKGEAGAKVELRLARGFADEALRRVRRNLRAAGDEEADLEIRDIAGMALERGGWPLG